MNDKTVGGVHWSFWGIGAVGLIFNLMGCINFISQMNADMVASMPEVYRAIVESRPAWATGAFAIAVFGGALGCLLLLLRKSVAVYVFIASLVGAVLAQIPFLGIPFEALIGGLSQLVVGAFLIWYSKQAESKGWII
jgi:uncharacterized membrane protein